MPLSSLSFLKYERYNAQEGEDLLNHCPALRLKLNFHCVGITLLLKDQK